MMLHQKRNLGRLKVVNLSFLETPMHAIFGEEKKQLIGWIRKRRKVNCRDFPIETFWYTLYFKGFVCSSFFFVSTFSTVWPRHLLFADLRFKGHTSQKKERRWKQVDCCIDCSGAMRKKTIAAGQSSSVFFNYWESPAELRKRLSQIICWNVFLF